MEKQDSRGACSSTFAIEHTDAIRELSEHFVWYLDRLFGVEGWDDEDVAR